MNDDLLERATAALRNETKQPEPGSGRTRARMLDSAAKAHARRGRPLRWLLPLAITFGTGTALAHVTHQYFPEVWNAVVPAALQREVPMRAAVRKLARAPVPARAPVLAPPAEAVAVAVAPAEFEASAVPEPLVSRSPAPQRERAPRSPAVRTTNAGPAVEPTVPEPPAQSAELMLYRRALALHDARQRGAVAAWDDFLRVAGGSPLALDARYNRALALLREGRDAEAQRALAPFASGELGGYRSREARALLDAQRDAGIAAPPAPR